MVKINKQEYAEVIFPNIENGEYAVSIIYDVNKNGKLDSNFIGIPTEPFGFSNNTEAFMGPPSFEKSKFLIINNKEIIITLDKINSI